MILRQAEYVLIGTPHQLAKCSQSPITIGDSMIPASNYVRNPGAYFDKHILWSNTSRSSAKLHMHKFTILVRYVNII